MQRRLLRSGSGRTTELLPTEAFVNRDSGCPLVFNCAFRVFIVGIVTILSTSKRGAYGRNGRVVEGAQCRRGQVTMAGNAVKCQECATIARIKRAEGCWISSVEPGLNGLGRRVRSSANKAARNINGGLVGR